MPARTHPSFDQPPDPNALIWRYLDLPKLVSFLMDQSVRLTRLDDLQDEYEGRVPGHAMGAIDAAYGTPRAAEKMMELVRASTFVNCWCCRQQESEALWRIYTAQSGVALCTRFAKLAQALPDDCFMGRVRYLEYEHQSPSSDTFFSLATHKRAFFSHEQEVRIVYTLHPLDRTSPPTQLPPTIPFWTHAVGFAAIDKIVLSPYSPSWFFPLVRDLLRRYECGIELVRSSMAVLPTECGSRSIPRNASVQF